MSAETQNEIWVDGSYSGAWSDCDQGEGWVRFVRVEWVSELLAANKEFAREEKMAMELLALAKRQRTILLEIRQWLTGGESDVSAIEIAHKINAVLQPNREV